jgi:hypothetical protein
VQLRAGFAILPHLFPPRTIVLYAEVFPMIEMPWLRSPRPLSRSASRATMGCFAVALVGACSGSSSHAVADGGGGEGGGGSGDGSAGCTGSACGSDAPHISSAAGFAAALGSAHSGHFLVGMGNDGTDSGDDPAYALGVTLDLHYQYLVGLSTDGGWTTYNSNPDYASIRIQQCKSHGVIPMFAYYAMADAGDGNLTGSVQDATYMTTYYKDFITLLSDVAAAGSPVVILHEPDFWGYNEQLSITNGGADKVPAQVAVSGAPECSGQPETIVGFAQCLLRLTRSRAPTALLGFHASSWGSGTDIEANTDPSFDVAGEAAKTVAFFKAIGADQTDFVSTDMLDRDAGCYEVAGTNCGSTPRTGVYWDETNATLPDFHQELTWATAITKGLGVPMIWWQLPFGVPSTTPGGTPGHYRDNRVDYLFAHFDEYVAAGGVGAVWGTGDSGQTDVTTDGAEYQNAATAYFKAPTALP